METELWHRENVLNGYVEWKYWGFICEHVKHSIIRPVNRGWSRDKTVSGTLMLVLWFIKSLMISRWHFSDWTDKTCLTSLYKLNFVWNSSGTESDFPVTILVFITAFSSVNHFKLLQLSNDFLFCFETSPRFWSPRVFTHGFYGPLDFVRALWSFCFGY